MLGSVRSGMAREIAILGVTRSGAADAPREDGRAFDA
jgi:hypothetical protein